jgi:glycerol-3-phosphate acyltransferase PlsX
MESHGRGEVDAVLSFGHTGAAVVAAQWKTGLVEGVARPGLAAILPNRSGYGLLMDVGANLKPKPLTLLQYALMAEEYCRHALDVARPKVGLLNVGEEKGKGDECRQEAFELMSRSDLGFVGNVEGGQVFDGSVDAVICGGFEGNVVLKASEGLASMLMDSVKKISSEGEDASRTLGGRLGEALTTQLSRRHDPSSRGVSRLLGVRGAVLIGHGNAKAEAIKSGLFQAFKEVQSGLQPALIDRLRKHSHP